MNKDTLEDELKFMKLDYMNLEKRLHSETSAMAKIIEDMREHIGYLYAKLELKIAEKKHCIECNGRGTFYISPVSDCGQSNLCSHCNGKGFRYV